MEEFYLFSAIIRRNVPLFKSFVVQFIAAMPMVQILESL